MKVVFLEDVPKIAKVGEIKEVANGYGRNFLIPNGLAAPVTPGVMNRLEAQRRVRVKEKAKLAEMAKELDGKEVILKAKAGTKNRLYGRVTNADIAAELKRTIGVIIDKRKIEPAEPICQLGSYEVTIRLTGDIMPKITVTVIEKESG